jgi:hypothetical protein
VDGAKTGGAGFFIVLVLVLVLVLEDLGSWREWDPPSPAGAGLRRDRPYGSQRSHRVFGRYQRAGCADAV